MIGWTANIQNLDAIREAAARVQSQQPRPVSLTKTYWRGADIVYSANFRKPPVPKFRDNTQHTGDHSG